MKPALLLISSLAALLTGCAGYNHTLFMTKSNAGLDFDVKPPTAEITVSRKEAVIAPAFEGGQTPPVIASFKPQSKVGGTFHNFFLGVDQTFAGGDAAVALAKLYGKTQGSQNLTNYDSALMLSQKPKYTNVFQRVPGPGEVRPFIFGTDTMLGLKVAWSGTGGQMPDSVKAGFNRKEFAWAPVTLTTNVCRTNAMLTTYSVKMPSFLATIDSEIGSSTNWSGISAMQYFATGDAATLLAVQPQVRATMLDRLDPNAGAILNRVTAKHDAADRVANHVAPNGRVDRAKLEELAKGTKLAQNKAWFDEWTGKLKDAFATALKEDYYALIPALAKNLPKN